MRVVIAEDNLLMREGITSLLRRAGHEVVGEVGSADALLTVATSVACDLQERLPKPVEPAAYFVVAEALANVAKYAQASKATVRAWTRDGRATIEIADNGIGGANDCRGTGLRGLTERLEALGGTLRVHRPAGTGTTITAELPTR